MSDQVQSEIEKYQKMLAADPNSKAFAPLADLFRKQGKFEDALKICREGLSKHPEYSGAEILLGRILAEKGNGGEAEKVLLGVIRRVPNHLLAHQLLARVYYQGSKLDHAKQIAKRIQQLDPNDATAHAILNAKPKAQAPAKPQGPTKTMAKLYEDQGHLDKALEIYKQLVGDHPEIRDDIQRVEKKQQNELKLAKLNTLLQRVESSKSAVE